MAERKLVVSKDDLERTYREMGSSVRVAAHFGVSKKLILVYLARFGIPTNRRNTPGEVAEKIAPLAQAGFSAAEIAESLGFTATHITQVAKKHGIVIPDQFHRGYAIASGYRLVLRPGHPEANSKGYVREHRLVAETMLGRPLNPDEVVHHVNGDREDNRPENLTVMTKAEHNRLHHVGKKGRGPDKVPRKSSFRR